MPRRTADRRVSHEIDQVDIGEDDEAGGAAAGAAVPRSSTAARAGGAPDRADGTSRR